MYDQCMAEILNEEPNWHSSRKGRYPWDEWFDGRVWHLKKGEDFQVASGAFRAAAANAAKSRHLNLKAKITPSGDVIVKAHSDESAAAEV